MEMPKMLSACNPHGKLTKKKQEKKNSCTSGVVNIAYTRRAGFEALEVRSHTCRLAKR